MTIQRSSSSSKRVSIYGSKKAAHAAHGGQRSFRSTLGPKAIRKYREKAQTDFHDRLECKVFISLVLLQLIVLLVMDEDEH
jgi:hypothetical protein